MADRTEIIQGNTVRLECRVFGEGGSAQNCSRLELWILRGERVALAEALPSQPGSGMTGIYYYVWDTTGWPKGEYTVLWRGRLLAADGETELAFVKEQEYALI